MVLSFGGEKMMEIKIVGIVVVVAVLLATSVALCFAFGRRARRDRKDRAAKRLRLTFGLLACVWAVLSVVMVWTAVVVEMRGEIVTTEISKSGAHVKAEDIEFRDGLVSIKGVGVFPDPIVDTSCLDPRKDKEVVNVNVTLDKCHATKSIEAFGFLRLVGEPDIVTTRVLFD